jgi:hypothetical protein
MALVSGELAFRSGLEIYMQKEVGRNIDVGGGSVTLPVVHKQEKGRCDV